jgi:hypothetical protein
MDASQAPTLALDPENDRILRRGAISAPAETAPWEFYNTLNRKVTHQHVDSCVARRETSPQKDWLLRICPGYWRCGVWPAGRTALAAILLGWPRVAFAVGRK